MQNLIRKLFPAFPFEQGRRILDERHAEIVRAGLHVETKLQVRVHQFGVDGRLCWDPATNGVEVWFLEVQFGIGRIDAPPLPGYRSPAELRERFGPEVG